MGKMSTSVEELGRSQTPGSNGTTFSKRLKERKIYRDDLPDDVFEGGRTFTLEDKITSAEFGPWFVKEMPSGQDFSLRYFQENGFDEPLLFHDKANLGMRLPSEKFNVNDVRMCVGSRRRIDVMDVITQKNVEMSVKEWCRYMNTPPPQRKKLLNVISLEFSHTKLENYVESPTVVRQVDWIDVVWPRHLKESQTEATNSLEDMKYPKVQKYCLMSVAGCYTDFHIDFGGTSVWYHILWGRKVFWLIPPTETNLKLYETWVLSGKQGDIFFGHSVEKCGRYELKAGDTFFIPTGWIHAVYTPVDTLVFGGNFLHSFGIEKQLRIAQVEDSTKVPQKFRYPFYSEMLWYVLQRYVMCLTGRNHLTCDEEGKPVSINCLLAPKVTSEMENIRLTRREVRGMALIIEYLQRLPVHRRNCPDLVRDAHALLEDATYVVSMHINDDELLAITGLPTLSWPDGIVKRRPLILSNNGPKRPQAAPRTPKGTIKEKDSEKARRRRTRCKKCDACLRTDCGDCHFCKDMRKFGGPGRMKQSCLARQCMAPVLPHTAQCFICKTERANQLATPGVPPPDDGTIPAHQLMECVQCWEIVHPDCYCQSNPEFGIQDGLLNEDLPNSWDCPKCCRDGKPEQAKSRHTKGGGGKGHPRVTPFVRFEDSPSDEKKLKLENDPSLIMDENLVEQLRNRGQGNVLENLLNKPITKPKLVVRPASYQETRGPCTEHVFNGDILLQIFSYLSVVDLANCQLVCKKWNDVCVDSSLWQHIDVSKTRLTSKMITGIVRRQPQHLNLSWTSVSREQVEWVLTRIPSLQSLHLRGCPFTSLLALNYIQSPFLKFLDISWIECLDDDKFKEVVLSNHVEAGALKSSKLKMVNDLRLGGNAITDSGIRTMCQYMTQIKRLDLSSCTKVTDLGIMMIASKLCTKLERIVLAHCPQITDTGIDALKTCASLEYVDARGCAKVSEDVCKRLLVCMPNLRNIREGKLVTLN